jgi:hypothetical protein
MHAHTGKQYEANEQGSNDVYRRLGPVSFSLFISCIHPTLFSLFSSLVTTQLQPTDPHQLIEEDPPTMGTTGTKSATTGMTNKPPPRATARGVDRGANGRGRQGTRDRANN